jgi:hypothetical protein
MSNDDSNDGPLSKEEEQTLAECTKSINEGFDFLVSLPDDLFYLQLKELDSTLGPVCGTAWPSMRSGLILRHLELIDHNPEN